MKPKAASGIAFAFLTAVFLNAFVDLGHKILIQNTLFKIYDGTTQLVLTAAVNALILLPYIVLLSPAGFISDRYAKHSVLRGTALLAVAASLGIGVCYYRGWFWAAFAMTLVLAIQSALYGPAKYAYLKLLYGAERLGKGNAYAQATVICAILMGTVVFSQFFENLYKNDSDPGLLLQSIAPLSWLLIATASAEFICILKLPPLDSATSERFDWHGYRNGRLLKANIDAFWRRPVIRLSIIGLSVFWALGQLLLAAFPTYAEQRFGISNTLTIQATMAMSGIGIAIGATIAGRLSKDYINLGLIPVGALGIAIGTIGLCFADNSRQLQLCFLLLGAAGGLFSVPLNALIQINTPNDKLGQVLAANFWVQNLAMVSILAITVCAALAGLDGRLLIQLGAAIALIGGAYTVAKMPYSLTRFLLAAVIHGRYRLHVQHLDRLPSEGGVLLLGNHVSWLDWAIIQLACPRRVRFVMTNSIYRLWYLKWFFKLNRCIPIGANTNSAKSLSLVKQALDSGELVCMFPEGTFSRTGQLMEFKRGFEYACNGVSNTVQIVPFYIRGLWGSQFSPSGDSIRQQRNAAIKREIIFAFGAAVPANTKADALKRKVFDLSISSWNLYIDQLPTLGDAFIATAKRRRRLVRVYDNKQTYSATRLFTAASLLSQTLRHHDEANIGVVLPPSGANIIVSMACFLAGKTLVPLNYSASRDALEQAIEQAEIKHIYSSRLFLTRLTSKGFAAPSLLDQLDCQYMEDVAARFSQTQRILHSLRFILLPTFMLKRCYWQQRDNNATAAILFSSGSEGRPKGVMLSHKNFMANIEQISDSLNPKQNDVLLSMLPAFHAFGLTIGQLLPVIEGIPVVCCPDPTDVKAIAKACAQHRATLSFATATLLNLYTRNQRIQPLLFASLRAVIAGAERLPTSVADAFTARFAVPVYEGYGCTETTPVASCNLPDSLGDDLRVHQSSKVGTVGMPLPGASFKIVDPDTLTELSTGEAGMVLIGGAQVMQAYLNQPERTAEVIKHIDGERWYITGDKGYLDRDGYLTIIDRYSRFAKIGGEMVSLSRIEIALSEHLPNETRFAATSIADERKGEAIVAVIETADDIDTTALKLDSLPAIMQPKYFLKVESLPVLGSGKINYGQLNKMARELVSNAI